MVYFKNIFIFFSSIQEATGALIQSLEGLSGTQESQSSEGNSDSFEFSNKDTILYALGGN